VFQSIAVPGWESILLELLGPGGKGLVRLPLDAAGARAWTFAELSQAVCKRGVLFGLELADGTRVYAPAPTAGPWREGDVRALWLMTDEA